MNIKGIARIALLAAVTSVAGQVALAQEQLSIGSTAATSPFYGYFVSVANIINDKVEGAQASVVESGASIENLKRIGRGQMDMGLITTNSLADAYNGIGAFEDAPVKSKLLWVYFTAPQMTFVSADSDITTLEQLEGTKFHTGMRGSSTEATTDAVLKSLGITVEPFRSGGPDADDAFKDGRIVGLTSSSMGPKLSASQIDLNSSVGLKPINLTDEQVAMVRKNHPQLSIVDIPAGAGDGLPAFTTWAFALGTSAGADMSEETAYQIVKAVMENRQPQTNAMKSTGTVDFAEATLKYATSPLHPGAIRYLREIGMDVPENLIAEEDR